MPKNQKLNNLNHSRQQRCQTATQRQRFPYYSDWSNHHLISKGNFPIFEFMLCPTLETNKQTKSTLKMPKNQKLNKLNHSRQQRCQTATQRRRFPFHSDWSHHHLISNSKGIFLRLSSRSSLPTQWSDRQKSMSGTYSSTKQKLWGPIS